MVRRLYKPLLLLLFLFFCSSSDVAAEIYYVSNEGSNSANGLTRETAWETIQFAVNSDRIRPGDEIHILEGEYLERVVIEKHSGTKEQPIIIRAADLNKKPILRDPNGTRNSRGFQLMDVSHYVIDSLKFTRFHGIGLTVENMKKDITNITVQNCEFIDGYRDSGHILRAQNRKNFVNGVNQTKKITQLKFIGNYIERGSPCQVENPKKCNEVITLIGNVHHSALINNTVKDSENIGINLIGRKAEWTWGSPRYIVYDGNTVINNYKPQNETTNNTTNGLYTDGSVGPVLMQNNTVLFDRASKPEEANGLLNGVVLNAEPAGAGELKEFEQFIVRNNYFETEFFSFNLGINQVAEIAFLERVAVVHNVGKNITTQTSNGSILLSGLKDFAFKNNVVVKTGGNSNLLISKTSAVWQEVTHDWSNRMDSEYVPTWELDGNIYYHPAGRNSARFKVGTRQFNNFSSYTDTGLDSNSYFVEPNFRDKDSQSHQGHYLAEFKEGVALTKTEGTGSNTNRVRLEDSKYFFDGFGIDGMKGDKIIIGDDVVTVMDVDYENNNPVARNTILVDKTVSYSDGEEVHYYGATADPQVGLLPRTFHGETQPQGNVDADYDNDGDIDIIDYSTLISYYGRTSCDHNLQGSCIIDILDYSALITVFSQ